MINDLFPWFGVRDPSYVNRGCSIFFAHTFVRIIGLSV